jgi:molybdopterin molybdotransferase
MLSIEEARARILADLTALPGELVSLDLALGRTLAIAVVATRALPGFDNSAMDGYAVRAIDLAAIPASLRVIGVVGAGGHATRPLAAGEAWRIFTGAPMPAGADSVVMQEDTEVHDREVHIRKAVRLGANVRRAGEDMRPGEVLARAGAVIGSGDVGALAAQGVHEVLVVRRPKVAIVPTGDEIIPIDREPGPGQVPNSNAHMLAAQVVAAGATPLVRPIVKDDRLELAQALRTAADEADLVLTSGGVSVGDFDHVRGVAEEHGSLDFWKVAMKPGKPLAFGRLFSRPFIGLPGNPVSGFVCFALFVAPALRKLAGAAVVEPRRLRMQLDAPVRPDKSRRELVRAHIRVQGGALHVEPVAKRGSHQLSSLVGVDALIDLASGTGELAAGAIVDVIVL